MAQSYEEIMLYLKSFKPKGMVLGLDRIRRLASDLGNPQNDYPSIIVGGTNGKGSTSAMIASILKEAGFTAGLYTSPHLFDIRERIRISGKMVKKEDFCKAVSDVKRAGTDDITFFELLTVVAFLIFKRANADASVLEVGLGGRLDATIITPSKTSVITNIGFDHVEILGNTLEKIAFEKAGIISDNSAVFTCERTPSAFKVIKDKCKNTGSRLFGYGKDFSASNISSARGGINFDFESENFHIKNIHVPLEGEFQIYNASIAIAATLDFAKNKRIISEDILRKGLANVRWRGRMEHINIGREVLFDCAHNSHAARYLAGYLNKECLKREIVLVYGTVEEKDYRETLSMLATKSRNIILTRPVNPRAKNPESIKNELFRDEKNIEVEDDPLAALRLARQKCPKDGIICVTGSIFLVAPLIEYADKVLAHEDKQQKKKIDII